MGKNRFSRIRPTLRTGAAVHAPTVCCKQSTRQTNEIAPPLLISPGVDAPSLKRKRPTASLLPRSAMMPRPSSARRISWHICCGGGGGLPQMRSAPALSCCCAMLSYPLQPMMTPSKPWQRRMAVASVPVSAPPAGAMFSSNTMMCAGSLRSAARHSSAVRAPFTVHGSGPSSFRNRRSSDVRREVVSSTMKTVACSRLGNPAMGFSRGSEAPPLGAAAPTLVLAAAASPPIPASLGPHRGIDSGVTFGILTGTPGPWATPARKQSGVSRFNGWLSGDSSEALKGSKGTSNSKAAPERTWVAAAGFSTVCISGGLSWSCLVGDGCLLAPAVPVDSE
mmetsp:Transcript_14971/g.45217  ORF Transcript_14971/g.45217 Transcript_14971/m.45217 type:complete len:336 (+) Transcript_14971:107-1114(+)